MKKELILYLVIFLYQTIVFVQNDFAEKIKSAKNGAGNNNVGVYEETLKKLFNEDYLVWIETVRKLKGDVELKYRKEGKILEGVINKRIYLSSGIKKLINVENRAAKAKLRKKIKEYANELFYLFLYVSKQNIQMLFAINNILKEDKNPLYIFEQVLQEVKREIKSSGSLEDKFIAQIILSLIDRYYLADRAKWLKRFINYEDVEIKKTALDIIAKFSYSDAIEEITLCLLDTSSEIRSYALEVLGDLYAVEKKSFVIKMLGDPSNIVRISAIRSARKLGLTDDESLTEIIKYLRDKDINVAIEVLYTIRYLNLFKFADEVFDLIKNIEIPDSKIESNKFMIVSKLINEGVITLTYLNYNKKEFRKFLIDKIIASNEPEMIKVALRTIGYLKIKTKGLVQDILQILNNPANDPQLRSVALYALGYLEVKDVIREYIINKLGVLEYNELETIYEISKHIYSSRLITELYKEYKKEKIGDEEKLYLRRVQVIQILTQFTFINKIKDVLIKIAEEEKDVRLINLIAEGLSTFTLNSRDYEKLYKVYIKFENMEFEDKEGYLVIARESVGRLIAKAPKYFNVVFKDYDSLPSISLRRITFLNTVTVNPTYLNDVNVKRIVDLLYNSKNPDNGYDHPSQVYEAVCSIVSLGVNKIIDDNLKIKLEKLIEKFEGNSKYYDAVYATKLLLLLRGERRYIDIMSDIQSVESFCKISEYLNLLKNKDFLNDLRDIRFKEKTLSGPAYIVLNLLNKILRQRKSSYTINYLNISHDILNRYILLKIHKGENLLDLLHRIVHDTLYGFTYIIYERTIVIYQQEQATNQWFLWYYKNKDKAN